MFRAARPPPRREHNAPGLLAPDALQLALDLPLRVAVGDGAALVAQLLALRERDLDLHPAILEVEPGRHEGHPLLPHLRVEAVELTAVPPGPGRPVRHESCP